MPLPRNQNSGRSIAGSLIPGHALRMSLKFCNLFDPECRILVAFGGNSKIGDRVSRKSRDHKTDTVGGNNFKLPTLSAQSFRQIIRSDSFINLHVLNCTGTFLGFKLSVRRLVLLIFRYSLKRATVMSAIAGELL